MKPLTKTFVVGGIATAVLGPALVAGAAVSIGKGAGQFGGILIEDGLPAVTEGFQQYEGGQTGGLFGEQAPLPAAPGGPANPAK